MDLQLWDGGATIRLVKLIEFRSIVSSFQQDVLDTHKDFNLISGRLLAGKILKDSNYVLKKIISEEKKKINFDLLVKKLYFQLLNEVNDLATENRYVRNISLNNAVDSLAIMILLKKHITTLNLKWTPIFLQTILTKESFLIYVRLRFNSLNKSREESINEINKILKEIN